MRESFTAYVNLKSAAITDFKKGMAYSELEYWLTDLRARFNNSNISKEVIQQEINAVRMARHE